MQLKGQFAIGNVYKRGNNYFIAIQSQTLVTRDQQRGEFYTFTTGHKGFIQVNELSVRKLCKSWKVPISSLDIYFRTHFSPSAADTANARHRKLHKLDEN